MTIVVRLFGFLAELQSALCSYGRPGVAEATQNWRTGARNQALSLSFGTWTEQPSAFCWIRDSAMDLVPRKLSLQPPERSDSAGQRKPGWGAQSPPGWPFLPCRTLSPPPGHQAGGLASRQSNKLEASRASPQHPSDSCQTSYLAKHFPFSEFRRSSPNQHSSN